jgi:hypothetical protein
MWPTKLPLRFDGTPDKAFKKSVAPKAWLARLAPTQPNLEILSSNATSQQMLKHSHSAHRKVLGEAVEATHHVQSHQP